MSVKNKKKFPVFWVLYALYTLLLAGAICFTLNLLWKFLDVYETTRPVHAMETAISILHPEKEASLRTYLTNTTENPYEDVSAILNRFYEMTKGQELTFGKLSGAYSESHPTYAVLAGDTHVATLRFSAQSEPVGYHLCGWDLESVTLLVSPKYSFALTVPSSMKVFINKVPIAEDAIVGNTATDTPVSYVDYAFSGLYEEPLIEVFDRYGSPVTLTYDAETGGYYYRLAYVTAPASMNITFGGQLLGEDNLLEDRIAIKELDFLSQVADHFSEYAALPERITIPTMRRYYVDFAYTTDSILCKNRFQEEETLSYDEDRNLYSHELVSDASVHDECLEFVYAFLEQYAMYCSRDAEKSALAPFFPENSEYYQLIVSMDNKWYNAHSDMTFEHHTEREFFAYSENLAYVHVSFDQKMKLRATGKYTVYPIDLPVWLVKINGNWYVARIVFDNFTVE